MSKAVLMSIRPKLCELIASGDKTIEIRKTRPKLETPFKCYIYETKGKVERPHGEENGYIYQEGRGSVVGEFMCDCIAEYRYNHSFNNDRVCFSLRVLAQLTAKEVCAYAGKGTVYGWHISALNIYDKAKKLSDFGVNRAPQSWRFINDSDKRI